MAVALAGRPVLRWLAGLSSSCRYITGVIYIAIGVPFSTLSLFSQLWSTWGSNCLDSGSPDCANLLKNIDERLRAVSIMSDSALALGAVMGSAASQHQALDGRLAAAAGLACTLVNAVLDLKEAARAIGVDVIGDRGAAEPYCVAQNLAQRQSKTLEFGVGEAVGPPPRPDACSK